MEMQRVEKSDDSLLSFLKIAAEKDDETITDDQIEEIHEALNKFNDERLVDMNRKYSDVLQKGNKIYCLCEEVYSMLMWSHYANNHEGFALEYNFNEMPVSDVRPRSLWPVIYENRLHDISLYLQEHRRNGFFNQFIGILAAIHKAADWKYEKEWRMIYPLGTSHSSNNFPVPTPKALYLGSKISDGDKLTLTRIANEKNIDVYEMELAHNEYKMVSRKI